MRKRLVKGNIENDLERIWIIDVLYEFLYRDFDMRVLGVIEPRLIIWMGLFSLKGRLPRKHLTKTLNRLIPYPEALQVGHIDIYGCILAGST